MPRTYFVAWIGRKTLTEAELTVCMDLAISERVHAAIPKNYTEA